MKKALVSIVLCLCFYFTSCDNEPYEGPLHNPEVINTNLGDPNNSDESNIPDDYQMSVYAKLDSLNLYFVNDQIITSDNISSIKIIATNPQHSIRISFPLTTTSQIFYFNPQTISDSPDTYIAYTNLSNPLQNGYGNGSITITNNDQENHRIEGIFQCGIDPTNGGSFQNMTQGTFDIIY